MKIEINKSTITKAKKAAYGIEGIIAVIFSLFFFIAGEYTLAVLLFVGYSWCDRNIDYINIMNKLEEIKELKT